MNYLISSRFKICRNHLDCLVDVLIDKHRQVGDILGLVYQKVLHMRDVVEVIQVFLRVPVLKSVHVLVVFLTCDQVWFDTMLPELVEQVVD
jgi:hypothetical protein